MKKDFNKNLITSEKEEEQFQLSNTCQICKKLIDHDDEKVRVHSHLTGKFRGTNHWKCNINVELNTKVPVIFHNLTGSDNYLILCELHKFSVKIDVMPNGLEKFMTFFLNKSLVFIDSMQFMNSSLDKVVKNLADNDFKYLMKNLVLKTQRS